MSRNNIEDAKIYGPTLETDVKFAPMVLAIAGATMTLDADSPPLVNLDPGQALTLTLPAVRRGLFFFLVHQSTGNYDITVSSPVNRAGAAGATTMGVISQNQIGIAISDGVTWFVGMMPQT